MKRSFVFVLLVILSCASGLAGTKSKYKVNVVGGTTKAAAGDLIELNLTPNTIIVIDETCALTINKKSGESECAWKPKDAVTAQFSPSSITDVKVVRDAHLVEIDWTANGQNTTLIIQPKLDDFPMIIGFLEEVTDKKSVNVNIQPNDHPRVLLRSQSYGKNQNALRDQSMEMATDFSIVCPTVQITINEQMADFTVVLNHIENGLLNRDNQIQVYNKIGDLISGNEGGSIMAAVKGACAVISSSWAFNRR